MCVPRSDLQHHAGWIAGLSQSLADLIDMRLMRHFHRNDLDAVFTGKFEDIRQAIFAVSLKRIRTRAGFICPHSRTNLTVFLQGFHHRLDARGRIDGAQSGEDIEIILTKIYTVIGKIIRPVVVLVPPQDAINLRHANGMFDARKTPHFFQR